MGMKPNVGRDLLDDRKRARLAVRCVGAPCVERLDALEEDAGERAEKRAVAGEDSSPREREREHPLTKRGLARENVLDHVCGRRTHASADARRAEASALARERHEQAVRAGADSGAARSLGRRTPQLSYAASSFFACLGTRTASAPSSMAPYRVSRLSRTTSYSVVVSGRRRVYARGTERGAGSSAAASTRRASHAACRTRARRFHCGSVLAGWRAGSGRGGEWRAKALDAARGERTEERQGGVARGALLDAGVDGVGVGHVTFLSAHRSRP